jgi:hypothetical protein
MQVKFSTWAEMHLERLLLWPELSQIWSGLTDFSYTP